MLQASHGASGPPSAMWYRKWSPAQMESKPSDSIRRIMVASSGQRTGRSISGSWTPIRRGRPQTADSHSRRHPSARRSRGAPPTANRREPSARRPVGCPTEAQPPADACRARRVRRSGGAAESILNGIRAPSRAYSRGRSSRRGRAVGSAGGRTAANRCRAGGPRCAPSIALGLLCRGGDLPTCLAKNPDETKQAHKGGHEHRQRAASRARADGRALRKADLHVVR